MFSQLVWLDCHVNLQIGLEKGLEMLNIFKSYSAKTSMLDDFNFYENREKSLNTKKSNKPATLRMEIFENSDFPVSSLSSFLVYFSLLFFNFEPLYVKFIQISLVYPNSVMKHLCAIILFFNRD
jgi:hypothetical protein